MAEVSVALREIEMAFQDVAYPGDKNLLDPRALDDHEIDIRALRGHSAWQGIPDSVLELESAGLGMTSPAAFRFFLPAYMQWVLRRFSSSDSFTVDSTIYALAPHLGTPEHRVERFALLTPAQVAAVVAFLRIMAASPRLVDAEVAEEALRSYWLPRVNRETA
jgi:uncharacterized protein DUF6714